MVSIFSSKKTLRVELLDHYPPDYSVVHPILKIYEPFKDPFINHFNLNNNFHNPQ